MRLFGYLSRVVPGWCNASRWIGGDELRRRIDRGEKTAVIDVREPDEFMGPLGHIAGAHNVPMSAFESRLGELASLERTLLVLVCRTDKRSAKAADIVRGAGLLDALVLRGGMEQWNDSGFPVEGGAENRQVLR
jgi:rhodanese-related sulfurtransferase